jgi:hypothetical protein
MTHTLVIYVHLTDHPGGKFITSRAGQDVSSEFEENHKGQGLARSIDALEDLFVGRMAPAAP